MRACRAGQLQIRQLTKSEIDRRIELLVAEVSAAAADERCVAGLGSGAFRPRWISARELVRRMRPYIVSN